MTKSGWKVLELTAPGTITLEPGTTSHSFAVSKNSLSSKIEVFARKEGITFDDVTKILQQSAPNLVAVDSPQFLSIQKEGLTLRNDPRRDNLCTGNSCTTKDVGQCVGHLGALRQLLETSEETPYELDAGEIAEIASEITRVSSRVKGGCTKEEKRALEDQIRRLKGLISKAKLSASRLEKEVSYAARSAQQKIKESEKEIDKLKKERNEKDKKLKERSDELNNIRTRCWKFFSSLPGASFNPTGQHVGSDENLKNPFGGKVNITDGDKFAETLDSSSVKRELKNCRKKIKETAEKAEELNDEVNKKQAELNQAEANHANLLASLNANLASLEAKLSLAKRAVQIFQNALDTLAEAARRCGIQIEQARKAELEKRAREAQMERERTRERRKEFEEREHQKEKRLGNSS